MNYGENAFHPAENRVSGTTVLVEVVEARTTSHTLCLLKDKVWPAYKGTYMTWITIIKKIKDSENVRFILLLLFFKKRKGGIEANSKILGNRRIVCWFFNKHITPYQQIAF